MTPDDMTRGTASPAQADGRRRPDLRPDLRTGLLVVVAVMLNNLSSAAQSLFRFAALSAMVWAISSVAASVFTFSNISGAPLTLEPKFLEQHVLEPKILEQHVVPRKGPACEMCSCLRA